uniref:Receptor ligand binding region domain-containing protein n=1 Tax=Romanomermis culicivorax TaxID=13658 RepID=A0A915KWK0_ROMCU
MIDAVSEVSVNATLLQIKKSISNSTVLSPSGWPYTLNVGMLISTYYPKLYKLAAQIAIDDLRSAQILPPDLNFTLYWRKSCDDTTAMNATLAFYRMQDVDVFFGPECYAGKWKHH